jgi:hypothetical protein
MAMALRRIASSVDKPIRPLFNGASLYYMVLSVALYYFECLNSSLSHNLLSFGFFCFAVIVAKRGCLREGKNPRHSELMNPFSVFIYSYTHTLTHTYVLMYVLVCFGSSNLYISSICIWFFTVAEAIECSARGCGSGDC